MKKINFLDAFGIFIILIGLIGSLYILKNWTGYSIFSDEEMENKTFEISQINNLVVREGSRKTISIEVENIGKNILNNCVLEGIGSIGSWIYSSQEITLTPHKKENFVFYLNVPESVKPGDYEEKFEIICDKSKTIQTFNISVLEETNLIRVLDIKQEKKHLNISYVFNNQNIIGNSVIIEIWVQNKDNEIKRIQDVFSINKDSLIERNILIKLPEDSIGMHYVYFTLSSDLEDFIKKSILLGKSNLTGDVIFEFKEGKAIHFIIFLIVIGMGILFIIKSHSKNIHKTLEDKGSLDLGKIK